MSMQWSASNPFAAEIPQGRAPASAKEWQAGVNAYDYELMGLRYELRDAERSGYRQAAINLSHDIRALEQLRADCKRQADKARSNEATELRMAAE